MDKIKVPERWASRLNIDKEQTYTMEQCKEFIKPMLPPSVEVTETMVISFFGLGATVNTMPRDLKYYSALSEQYKEFLKEQNFNLKRIEPARAKNGSFELWAYYHLGLHSFTMNLFRLPSIEKKEKNNNAKKENRAELFKEKYYKRQKALIEFYDSIPEKGFVDWQEF